MKGRVFKVAIVLMLILAMTMSNFLIIGNSLISYAISKDSTSNKNVQFNAYFKNANGEKISDLEMTTDNMETSLFVSLGVLKEGYLNGTITIEDSNFTIKGSESEYVNKIEGNKIVLNQLNAESNIEIEIKIAFNKLETIDESILNKENTIKLDAIYRNSSEKDIKIEETRKANLRLVSNVKSEEITNNLEVITNKVLKINDEEKRVLQISLKTGLTNNSYPIKNIDAEVTVPVTENMEVENNARLNNMTKTNCTFDGKVTKVRMTNEAGNWKTGNEEIILTYMYLPDVEIDENNISAKQTIELYDGIKVEATQSQTNTKESLNLDNVVVSNIINKEDSIFKGKLYSGIDRQFENSIKMQVNLGGVAKKAEIETMQDVYSDGTNTINANTYLVQSKINKQELTNILGQDGTITITDQNGSVVAIIDANSETDENGDIIINYAENTVKSIKAITSELKTIGELNIRNINKIMQTNKEIIKAVKQIDTGIKQKYTTSDSEVIENEQTQKIDLKETTTNAKITTSKNSLSTINKNNVEIKAILESNNESNDLYKNPVIKITLPSQIQEVNVNSIKLLYEDQLQIVNAKLLDENGKKVILISLNGEQTNYKDMAIEGLTVLINADLKLDRKATSSDEAITLSYTNENVNNYKNGENIGEESVPVSIVSPKGLITVNNIENLGVETIGDTNEQNVMLEKGKDAQTVKVETEIINNNDSGISNVAVLGTFPTNKSKIDNKQSNIDTKIASEVAVEGANAKVYYSENENATSELTNSANAWKENIENNANVKKYLIIVDNMENAQSIKANYDVEIPKNLEYNEEAYTGYSVDYTNATTGVQQNAKSTTISTQTGVGPVIESSLSATVGNETLQNNAEIKTGEVIKYSVTVKNTGTEDATNVKISGQIPNGTTYVEPENLYEYTGASYYNEIEKQTQDIEVGTVKVGESVTKTYEVRVNSNTADGTSISNKITTFYGDAKQETNEIKNTVKSGTLRTTAKRVTDSRIKLTTGDVVEYSVIIENLSNETQKNVKLHTNLPENVEEPTMEKITGLGKLIVKSNGEESDQLIVEGETGEEKTEELDYSQDLNIGDIEAGKNVVIKYTFKINQEMKAMGKEITFSANAIDNSNNTYRSNAIKDVINKMVIETSFTSAQDSKTLKTWDEVEYKINIKNLSSMAAGLIEITDIIPEQLNILSVSQDGNELELEENENNKVYVNTTIPANDSTEISVKTEVGESLTRTSPEVITNKADISLNGELVQSTSEISNVIEPSQTAQDNTDNGDDNNNDNNNGDNTDNNKNNNINSEEHIISGTAWLDENSDGKKDSTEQLLSGIKVRLLNVETNEIVKDANGNEITATTENDGTYILRNVPAGKYIVVFEYDTSKYGITAYQKEGLAQSESSNAVSSKLNIDGQEKTYGTTDTIEISDVSVTGINIGLTELKNFDIQLDKYVSKVTVQDSKGTSSYSYDESKLAKIELPAKQIDGAMVTVEYGIKVTNCGEVDAYASKIVDYMSSEFKFSSELNKDWYQSGENIYNASLANEKIPAGESREVKLILTKQMTEDNTGLINNTAEIAEQYNEAGFEDTNSTPGNKKQGENDMSSADIIISVKTGAVTYVAWTIVIIAIIGLGVFIIKKKVLKDKI